MLRSFLQRTQSHQENVPIGNSVPLPSVLYWSPKEVELDGDVQLAIGTIKTMFILQWLLTLGIQNYCLKAKRRSKGGLKKKTLAAMLSFSG